MAAGAAVAGSRNVMAQAEKGMPPSVVTSPPRDFGPNAPPNVYVWDPDIVIVDPLFMDYIQGNGPIQRLWTGALWSEGPAWCPGPVSRVERHPEQSPAALARRYRSGQHLSHAVEQQQRQHLRFSGSAGFLRAFGTARCPLRHDGSATVIANSFNGRRLNSPNDVVPHPDGSIWFTDPPYGGQLYEGEPDLAGGPSNPSGRLNPRIGQPAGFAVGKRELPTAVYRADPWAAGCRRRRSQLPDPNGLCFSPDYKRLYVISTGKGPGDTGAGGKRDMHVFDVGADNKLSNQKLFNDFMVDGIKCSPDGARCDVDGNLWVSSNARRDLGYSGVTVWTRKVS